MRVILVIVLCLSSGFGQNDVKLSAVTENADTNSALEDNSDSSDSATVKGATFINAISIDSDQTDGYFTHLLSIPVTESTISVSRLRVSKAEDTSHISPTDEEPKVAHRQFFANTIEATGESTKDSTTASDGLKNIDVSSSSLFSTSRTTIIPNYDQSAVSITESTIGIDKRTSEITTIENEQQIPNINLISRTSGAIDESTKVSVVKSTAVSDEINSIDVSSSFPTNTDATTGIDSLPNNDQIAVGTTSSAKDFVVESTSEGSENVIVSPSVTTHLSMSNIPDSTATVEKRSSPLNTVETEQNSAQTSFASSTPEDKEESSTDSTSPFPSDGSTTEETTTFVPTTLACTDPDPPFIYYKDYILYWNTNQSSNCYTEYINLTCVPGYTWMLPSSTTFLDLRSEKVPQKQIYTCKAFITTTNGVNSGLSNTLELPTGSKSIAPVLNNLILEWEPPFVNASLIYTININGNAQHQIPSDCPGSDSDSRVTAITTTNISLKADFYYKINIQTSFWELLVQNFTEFLTESSAPDPPRSVSLEQTNDGYYLTWKMPCQPNGIITGYRITLTEHDQKTVEPTTETFKFTDLKPATHYTGSIAAVGSNNYMSEEVSFDFTTDGLPNTPQLSISSVSATSFTIEWIMLPDFKNNNKIMTVTYYELYIDVMGPTYTPGSLDCKQPSPNTPLSLLGSQHNFTFTKAWPSYQYNVSLIAYSLTGPSPTGHIEVTTNMSVPEAPVDLKNTTAQLTDNTYPLSISWNDPCKINGQIKSYWLEIKERYTEEQEIVTFFNDTVPNKIYNNNFKPSHEYVVSVAIKLIDGTVGPFVKYQFTTDIGYPGLPIFNTTKMNITSQNMTVYWEKPVEKTGPIELYELTVKYVDPLYKIPNFCLVPRYDPIVTIIPNQMHHFVDKLQPYSRYELQIRARTRLDRYGSYSVENVTTLEAVPDNVTNITTNCTSDLTFKYNATLDVYFKTPCNMYGAFTNFSVNCDGNRNGYKAITLDGVLENAAYSGYNRFSTKNLSAQFDYICNLTVNNGVSSSEPQLFNFKSPAGEPNFDIDFDSLPLMEITPENVQIHLKKRYFQTTQADAQYIALVISPAEATKYVSYRRELSSWPSVQEGSKQITPDFWYPFNDTEEFDFMVGDGSIMNPALEPDTKYHLYVRVVTDTFYTDSPTLEFTTDKLSKAGLIVGLIFAILILGLLGAAGFFVWRRKLHRKFIEKYVRKSVVKTVTLSPTAVPVKKFVQYFQSAKNKPEMFKQQFMEINDQGKEIQDLHTSNFAKLLENKRKNRYVNILPFDATRVKLLIDEDDEIGSDYVNASYIKGYTGDIEYIATQGPLVSTCRDFWKLVLQENVTIIVMVANFIEKNKEKCHKYFPENHENLIVGDNMEIRCATELHFGTHVVRNLQVRKDCTQVTVTHMQFLEWPDFRVPSGTEHMLQFCYKLRERVKLEGGIMIVHCSAGVGRTGTLIAADMLLQDIAAKKALDVYKTVLDLRRQRCMMVQTEEQYVYLHRLLADHIDRPPTPDNAEASDPVYENMDMIKRSTNSDYKTSDDEESGF